MLAAYNCNWLSGFLIANCNIFRQRRHEKVYLWKNTRKKNTRKNNTMEKKTLRQNWKKNTTVKLEKNTTIKKTYDNYER